MMAKMAKDMIARDNAASTRENAPAARADLGPSNLGRGDIEVGASGVDAREGRIFSEDCLPFPFG